MFLYTKIQKFMFRSFSWEFLSWHIYTKSMTLFVTCHFYRQKAQHLATIKTNFVTFLYTNRPTLCDTRFLMEILKLVEGGGHFYMQKMQFALHFYMQKTMHIAFGFKIYNLWYNPDT